MRLLSEADRQLGRLDMFSNYIPNIDLYIYMHVVKEANQSSSIEGTQTKIDEVLLDKEDLPTDKRDDWEEVQNYIEAMEWAVKKLEGIPFSSRLIRQAHKILMQGVRGETKQPGQFRKSQNWIGGATLNDATFVPPVHSSVPDLISDIEKFWHNNEIFMPELLKIALVHYQFETIHPFLDGNGRVGRLMIPLYLVSRNILKRPILYLSDFFEKNRKLYYENLTHVRESDDISQWFKFFLVGLIETAKNGILTFEKTLELQKDVDLRLQKLGSRAANAQKVVNSLYKKFLVDAYKVSKITGLSKPSSYHLISDLEKMGILSEITGGKRGRSYIFSDYLRLFT